jgi:hypothetical protein
MLLSFKCFILQSNPKISIHKENEHSFIKCKNVKERIKIILMAGSGSSRKTAMYFNRKHGKKIKHNTVAKLTEKFKKTGSVTYQLRSGCPCRSTDERTTNVVLGAFARSPQKSIQRLDADSGVSRLSITRILKNYE